MGLDPGAKWPGTFAKQQVQTSSGPLLDNGKERSFWQT